MNACVYVYVCVHFTHLWCICVCIYGSVCDCMQVCAYVHLWILFIFIFLYHGYYYMYYDQDISWSGVAFSQNVFNVVKNDNALMLPPKVILQLYFIHSGA